MEDVDEIVQEFLVESHEGLDRLDRDLVALERDPGSRELLAGVFRTVHTIKGTSGFLAFDRLGQVTHAAEGLLSRLRDGELTLTPDRADVLLRLVDVVRALLDAIARTGGEADVDVQPVLLALQVASAGEPDGAPEPSGSEPEADAAGPVAAGPVAAGPDAAGPDAAGPGVGPETPGAARVDESAPATPPLGELLVKSGLVTPDDIARAIAAQTAGDTRRMGEILVAMGAVSAEALDAVLGNQAQRSLADASVRVDVELLDHLVGLVGELVLTRNQLLALAADGTDPELLHAAQRLNVLAADLQGGVMRTRMQPIDRVWARLPRLVRDVASSCGKRVRLVMEGHETELDRGLLEAIKDPLIHLVRNAVDHGIETPAERQAAGKPAEGMLTLRATHESGQVVIEVSDDGSGIDPDVIGPLAVARGVVTAAELAVMEPAEVVDLVFRPGFSSAAQVTSVSGRGVGMDVVRTDLARIDGTAEIESRPGQGTTCRLTIPLTLAIVAGVTVECGGDPYALPQASLLEIVTLDGSRRGSVEHVGSAPVHRLRGHLLPLVSLAEVLGVSGPPWDRREVVVAVLQVDGWRFGLAVDRVVNAEEIVVQPVSAHVTALGVYAGATVLGDGRLALILDVPRIAHDARARGTAPGTGERQSRRTGEPFSTPVTPHRQHLVVSVDSRRVAVPVEQVARLAEVPATSVEMTAGGAVTVHRNEVLRLVGLPAGARPGPASHVVVVGAASDDPMGVVVDEIADIVALPESAEPEQAALPHSVLLDGRPVDVVTMDALAHLVEDRS